MTDTNQLIKAFVKTLEEPPPSPTHPTSPARSLSASHENADES